MTFAHGQVAVFVAAFIVMSAQVRAANAQQLFPGSQWEKADPAKAGWSMAKLQAAEKYFRAIGSTAVMIVQDGRVIAAYGDVTKKVHVRSVRKSIMSALYGVAVGNRKIDLTKTLAQLNVDDRPPTLTATEKQATVRQLLMARSGVYHEAANETDAMQEKRPDRGSHAPGSFWYYNNWDFNVLGVILRQATGEDTFVAVKTHLAEPLQMEDFVPSDGRYAFHAASDHPAYVMHFTARDLARFGWLFLNKGNWRGKQVVPETWVAESTRPYSDTERGTSYGYMWWVAPKSVQFRTEVGPGAYSARGNGGQFIMIMPARRIVVVHLNDLGENSKLGTREFGNLLQLIMAAAPPPS